MGTDVADGDRASGPQDDGERDDGGTTGAGQADGGRDGGASGAGQADGGRASGPQAEGGRASGPQAEGGRASGPQAEGGRDGGRAGAGGSGDGGSVDVDRVWRALEAEGLLGQTEPDVIQATRRISRTPAEWIPVHAAPDEEEDEEHFVPPEPLPLPKLNPVTKGAWAALFGGPGYLMISTALRWSVPGYAAFLAVAAFVTGFVLLVLRMNDPGPGGPDDGDDGAVV